MKKIVFTLVVLGLWATAAFAEPAVVAGEPAYTLQLGAFGRQTAAENAAARLEGKGLTPYVVANQRGLFVVRHGAFATREEARQTADRLKAEGVLESSLIVKTTVPLQKEIPAVSEAPITPELLSEPLVEVTPHPEELVAENLESVPDESASLVQTNPEVTMGSKVTSALEAMTRQPLGPQNLGFRAAKVALDFIGVKYLRGGMSREKGMDCSGFVKTVYALCGIHLPRTSSDQYRHGRPVGRGELAIGDLVFFGLNQRVNHVGIYLGEGKYIHAPRPKETIRISNLEEKSTLRRFLGGRRLPSED